MVKSNKQSLALQLEFEHFQYISLTTVNLVGYDQKKSLNGRPSYVIQCAALVKIVTQFLSQ